MSPMLSYPGANTRGILEEFGSLDKYLWIRPNPFKCLGELHKVTETQSSHLLFLLQSKAKQMSYDVISCKHILILYGYAMSQSERRAVKIVLNWFLKLS